MATADTTKSTKTVFDQARYDYLTPLFGSLKLTDAEDEEYLNLRKLKREQEKGRKTLIASLIKQLTDNEVSLADLVDNSFITKEELKKQAKALGISVGGSGSGSTTPSTRVSKKSGIELFSFKPTGSKGKSSTFNQGQDKPVAFGKGHEYLKAMKGDVTDNLMKHLTTKDAEKATAYLKTPEGKAELAKIAQYITSGGESWGEAAKK